jgi:hypothetical protein
MLNALIIIGVALVFISIAFTLSAKYKKIAAEGTEAEGIIFDKVSSSISIGGNYTNSTYPVVRFVTQDKEWITEQASVSMLLPWSYKKGQEVTVIYRKEKPTDFFIKSTSTRAVINIMGAAGVALLAWGMYLLLTV